MNSRTTALLLLLPTIAVASLPPGTIVEDAVVVDVTEAGFEAITSVLPTLLPSEIPIDDIGDDGGIYEYALENMWIGITVDDATITPENGYLDVAIDLSIQVNASDDKFSIFYEILWVIGETCYGYIAPFEASITTQIGLSIYDMDGDGINDLDAEIMDISFDLDIDGANDINIDSCSISYIEEVLNFFGLSIWDIALTLAEPLLDSAIEGFLPDLEETIEDAFSQAQISDSFDLGGVVIDLELYPANIEIEPAGLRLGMNGGMSSDQAAECISEYDPGGSLSTVSDPPGLATAPSGVSSDYHMGLLLSDDFGNQALYSLWRGGLLCYEITAEDDLLPIALDTSILGLLAGDAFSDLFPESKPLVIQTRPRKAPELDFASDHNVAVVVEDLGLEFYGELDHRQALILGLDLTANVGVDIDLDDTTGELGIEIDLGSDAVTGVVGINEFNPSANTDIEANFADVYETLVMGIVSGLLEDLVFPLPSMEGFGLTGLELSAAGSDEDWLGAYASVGIVSYDNGGCTDEDGGCSSEDGGCASTSGCEGGGCATGGPSSGRWMAFSFAMLAAIFMRRREDD